MEKDAVAGGPPAWLDKAQSVVNVLAALDTTHMEMLNVAVMLLAYSAEQIGISDEELLEGVRSALQGLRPFARAALKDMEGPRVVLE